MNKFFFEGKKKDFFVKMKAAYYGSFLQMFEIFNKLTHSYI
jgi:hypothetical protein